MQIDVDAKLNFTTADLIGSRCAVLGVSGSGKSMTARVLVEELLPSIPMTLVDIEGELWSLKEQFDILHVGSNFRAESDLIVAPEDAGSLATWVWANNVSVILDMSEFDDVERDQFLLNYFEALWTAASRAPKPHTILIEEIHEFVPEDGTSPIKDLFTRYAKRGRKRGVGMIFVSQRSAEVAKSLLSQATMFFLHHVADPTDMAVYAKRMTPVPAKQVPALVSGLGSGDCLVMHHGKVEQVRIRMSTTHHVGATPTGEETQIELKQIDAAMLEQLRGALGTESPAVIVGTVRPVAVDDEQVKRLMDERDSARHELHELRVEFERYRADYKQAVEQAVAQYRTAYEKQTRELDDARRQLTALSQQVTRLKLENDDAAPPPQQTKLPLEPDDDDGPYRSPLALTRRKKAQERRFIVLLDHVEKLTPMVREIAVQLGSAPAQKWRISELARQMYYSEDRVGKACRTLLEMELLRRDNPQTYQGNLAALWQKYYPDLDPQELEERLFNVCIPQKLAGA